VVRLEDSFSMGSFIYSRSGDAGSSCAGEDKGLEGTENQAYTYATAPEERSRRGDVKADFYEPERRTGLGNVQPWRRIKRTNDRFIDFQFSMSRDVTNGDSMSGANVT